MCALLENCVFLIAVGFEVDQLIDGYLDTYWQSDGPQPNHSSSTFSSAVLKTTITDILCMYADYKADESYTPSRRVGFSENIQ